MPILTTAAPKQYRTAGHDATACMTETITTARKARAVQLLLTRRAKNAADAGARQYFINAAALLDPHRWIAVKARPKLQGQLVRTAQGTD